MKFEELGIDYLLVNATNKFLLEYAPIEENSCHNLTGFTGDTGDALVCPNGKIKLFVDGRYHTQADLEVDKSVVEVVKLQLGQKQDDEICASVKPNSTFGIVTSKVSQKRFEYFKTLLNAINVNVKPLDIDIYEREYIKNVTRAEFVPNEICGEEFNTKIRNIEKPVLFTNSEELTYLCNIRDFSQNYAVKVDGKLYVSDDENILFTDTLVEANNNFTVKPLNEFNSYIKKNDFPIRVDKSTITAFDYSLIKTPITQTSPVKLMKSIKNKQEIEHLKYCFEMTDKALMATRQYIYDNEGLSEYDIDKELEKNFKRYGAKSLSFKSIVAINKNSALAHYMKSSKDEILHDGDLILLDCGAYYDGGLATDITRVFVKGNPSKLHKRVYTTVLKMFLNAFNYQFIEGKTCGYEIDKFTRKVMGKNEVGDFVFSHGLGHGIGICVHEAPPNLSMNEIAKTPIQENMCFTIEPGLYNNQYFGVRLENSCYIENGIIKSFSNMCYESKLIDYSLLSEEELTWLKEFEVL
ncbi:MAG: M24 family metallopeptidase [Candidatus Gastranaerophilales bacterium]|nr:M24 family metallopeptidase [Candidatus Gastranaerophilales bacterium]